MLILLKAGFLKSLVHSVFLEVKCSWLYPDDWRMSTAHCSMLFHIFGLGFPRAQCFRDVYECNCKTCVITQFIMQPCVFCMFFSVFEHHKMFFGSWTFHNTWHQFWNCRNAGGWEDNWNHGIRIPELSFESWNAVWPCIAGCGWIGDSFWLGILMMANLLCVVCFKCIISRRDVCVCDVVHKLFVEWNTVCEKETDWCDEHTVLNLASHQNRVKQFVSGSMTSAFLPFVEKLLHYNISLKLSLPCHVSGLFLMCGFACMVYGLAMCFPAILFSELNLNP